MRDIVRVERIPALDASCRCALASFVRRRHRESFPPVDAAAAGSRIDRSLRSADTVSTVPQPEQIASCGDGSSHPPPLQTDVALVIIHRGTVARAGVCRSKGPA